MLRALTLAVVLLVLRPFPSAAHELYIEDVFERTAGLFGDSYAISRDLLVRQGNRIAPFLRKRAQGEDWRERDLARAILLRLEDPDKLDVLKRLLLWEPKLDFRKDGTVQGEQRHAARRLDRGCTRPQV